MANYGQIQTTGKERYPYKGNLSLPSFGGEIALEVIEGKRADKAPTHGIIGKNANGVFPAGSAWMKTTKEGKPFFSLKIDHPEMVAAVWVNAFQNDEDPTKFDIQWTRQRGEVKTASNTQDSAAFK